FQGLDLTSCLQKLEELVNQNRRPEQALDDAKHAGAEGRRVADKIDEGADNAHTVDGPGSTVPHAASKSGLIVTHYRRASIRAALRPTPCPDSPVSLDPDPDVLQ